MGDVNKSESSPMHGTLFMTILWLSVWRLMSVLQMELR